MGLQWTNKRVTKYIVQNIYVFSTHYIIMCRTIATIALGPYDFVLITYTGNSLLFRVNHDKINVHELQNSMFS